MSSTVHNTEFHDVPLVWAFGIPVVSYVVHFILGSFGQEFYHTYVNHESGFTELLTLLMLALAIGFAVAALRYSLAQGRRVLTSWLVVFVLGSIYFLGEEASWGQHIFGWGTPEGWADLNDQEETNLHNMGGIVGSLLDQVPRAILTFSALVFGFAYPLWRSIRSIELPTSGLWYWLVPTSACIVVGLLAPLASIPGKFFETPPAAFDLVYGAIKELLLAQFMMIYAWSLYLRLRQAG